MSFSINSHIIALECPRGGKVHWYPPITAVFWIMPLSHDVCVPDYFFYIISREYLDSVHDNFVLAPADKASNNVIIICKKFYYDVLARDLGVDAVGGSSGNDTYKTCSLKEEKLVHDHISFLGKFNITLEAKDKFLPSLYWLPKLHKDPYKFRYIVASSHCTTKHLSILLTNGLEKIQRYFMNRCKIIFGNSGINGMWILKNSQSLLQSIRDNHVE